MAFQHLQKGLQEGWNPDASLFEYVIQAFCVADNKEQAERVLASMPDLGCPSHTVHINLLVELVARLEGARLQSSCLSSCRYRSFGCTCGHACVPWVPNL